MAIAKFTTSAAQKIVKATKQVLGAPIDQTDDASHKRSYYDADFPAKITGSSGTFGTPLHYAWSEVNESGSGGTQDVKSGGRSGTTTIGYARNDYEVGGGQAIAPIANGTIVRMRYTFDASGNKFYRFYMLQLPALAQYQGWYGTVVDGASITTINADNIRAI